MTPVCDLIRWIITYAVTGGFLHFVAVLVICWALARATRLVRVSVDVKQERPLKSQKEAA